MSWIPIFLTSDKPCPRDGTLLHWSEKNPPEVHFDVQTGFVSHVDLTRFCPQCGYKEVGFVNVDKDPVWTEIRED